MLYKHITLRAKLFTIFRVTFGVTRDSSDVVYKVVSDCMKLHGKNNFTSLLLFGFSKPFDCVDHETLSVKLESCGTSGQLLSLILYILQIFYPKNRTTTSFQINSQFNPLSVDMVFFDKYHLSAPLPILVGYAILGLQPWHQKVARN